MQIFKQRKGALGLGDMANAALSFVIIMVVIFVGAMIGAGFQNQTDPALYPVASQVVTNGLTALSSLSQWMPMLALVIAGAIILAVVAGALGGVAGGTE
jgi:hypothetical protein